MAPDDDLLTREEVLGGLPARRARVVLFLIERQTAHMVARSGQLGELLPGERAARERDLAFVQAFAMGREAPVRLTIHSLERYATQWAHLVPDNPTLRASLARLLSQKYSFTAAAVPGIRGVLGLDQPAVREAHSRLHGRPLETIYAERTTWRARAGWAWAALGGWLDTLSPFWFVFVFTLTPGLPQAIVAFPIAVAAVGPLPGIALNLAAGLLSVVTTAAVVEELVTGRNVIAMRVVDHTIVTLVYSAVPGEDIPQELSEDEKTELREVMSERQTRSYLDGSVLKIMARIMSEHGNQAIAATIVHLPAERFLEAIRRNLRLAGVVAAGVLSVGLVASVILARWVTGPVSRLTAAATALEIHTFDPESLAEVTRRPDELGHLARVFHRMALEVPAREQRLQQQVQQLRIEIDDAKKVRQVAEIAETDYVQDLRQRGQGVRARVTRPQGGPSASGHAPSPPGAH